MCHAHYITRLLEAEPKETGVESTTLVRKSRCRIDSEFEIAAIVDGHMTFLVCPLLQVTTTASSLLGLLFSMKSYSFRILLAHN